MTESKGLTVWLLTQYTLLATDELPDLHLRPCLGVQPRRPAKPDVGGQIVSCDCLAINWWLADLAAKRQIVETIQRRQDDCFCDVYDHHDDNATVLRLLAEQLSGRPGYREEWRP